MNLKTFQAARKMYLSESLDRENNQKLYEFLSNKYEEVLYEGIFSSVMNWFKKNFSPRASKIRSLGKEYYDWLMQEFNANYKGRDTDSDLKDFLKKEFLLPLQSIPRYAMEKPLLEQASCRHIQKMISI
jgi:hypothetical protein